MRNIYLYNRNIANEFFSDRLIYTKGITVFKYDKIITQILPKNDWFKVDIITCAFKNGAYFKSDGLEFEAFLRF